MEATIATSFGGFDTFSDISLPFHLKITKLSSHVRSLACKGTFSHFERVE